MAGHEAVVPRESSLQESEQLLGISSMGSGLEMLEMSFEVGDTPAAWASQLEHKHTRSPPPLLPSKIQIREWTLQIPAVVMLIVVC